MSAQLPDWLANAAKSTGYGADAYKSINWVLSQKDSVAGVQVNDALSVISLATSGTLDVAAANVALGLVSDVVEDLGELALEALMDVAGDIGGQVVSEMAGAVPLIGSAVKIIAGIIGSIAAEDDRAAEEAKKKAKAAAARACAQSQWNNRIISSGGSTTNPSDYFIQCGMGHFINRPDDARQVGEFWTTDRAPFIGRVLIALTEGRYTYSQVQSAWADRQFRDIKVKNTIDHGAHFMFGAKPDALAGWGRSAEYQMAHGVSQADAYNYEQAIIPWTTEFQPFFANIRNGIVRQSWIRHMEGLGGGDGGQSLWPIYMDLLKYLLVDDQSGFLHKSHKGKNPGYPSTTPTPRIPYQFAMTMLGSWGACGQPPAMLASGTNSPGVRPRDWAGGTLAGFGDPCHKPADAIEAAMCHARTTTNTVEGAPYLPWLLKNVNESDGNGWQAVRTIYTMAQSWAYKVKPGNATDAKKLAGQLAEVYAEAQARSSAKLATMRNAANVRADHTVTAAHAIAMGVKAGMVDPAAADVAADVMLPGGMGEEPASALPWVLGAGAAAVAIYGASTMLKGKPWRG
jgi:hypothetical protein